jgi:hypothetical protein
VLRLSDRTGALSKLEERDEHEDGVILAECDFLVDPLSREPRLAAVGRTALWVGYDACGGWSFSMARLLNNSRCRSQV